MMMKRVSRGLILFTVGRSIGPEIPISEVGKAVASKLPEILESSIQAAINNKGPNEDVLDWIHHSLSWNFYATAPESVEATDKIHQLAFKLFSEKVAGADQILMALVSALRQMVRPPVGNQSLGETFQAVVPIPQHYSSPTFAGA